MSARQIIGAHLRNVRTGRGLTIYASAKRAGISFEQLESVEDGTKAYTIDTFLKVIYALDLYLLLKDKEGNHLNFEHMQKKMDE